MVQQLVLPSQIPWEQLKGTDLEECLYWLTHALGGKDLEWRVGGVGGGAADGGRDLSATFFSPGPDGEISRQKWWIEAKGRSGTVEPSAVKESVLNAAGRNDVDTLAMATNSVFSNPTRDWVAEWQRDHPRPLIRLWDRHQLERLLSERPDVVIRLYSQALSMAGKLEVVRFRFWNYTAYAGEPALAELWRHRNELEWSEMDLLAALVSECANGDIARRPWAMVVGKKRRIELLRHALLNILYFCFRADDAGVAQEPYIDGAAYLLLACLYTNSIEEVRSVIHEVWSDGQMPDEVKRHALTPVMNTLGLQLRDLCTDDCKRVLTDPITLSEREMKEYWARLRKPPAPADEQEARSEILIIEKTNEACKVGFTLDQGSTCPIVNFDEREEKLDIDARLTVMYAIIRSRAPGPKGSGAPAA